MSSEVSSNIGKFKKDLSDRYIPQALRQACTLVQESAIRNCPKGDTGHLAQSIDFTIEDDEGCIYTNVEYAPYVEIGTGIYSSKGTGRKTPWVYKGKDGWVTTVGTKPQPFMEPALNENKDRIAQCFGGLF